MKKSVLFSLALITAAAVSCGEKAPQEDSSSSTAPETSAAGEEEYYVDPEGNVLYEKPTDRVRDIEETADFEYEIVDGHAVITKYTGSAENVTVPGTIEEAPVTEIGFYAFEAKYDIRSITLPETVTLIGEGAFMDCASMETVNIPEAVTGIDRGAFVSCTSLKELDIPANVAYIHEEAFTACESMTALRINNPDLAYENWGLEELPELTVYAPEGSAVLEWAQEKGFGSAAS